MTATTAASAVWLDLVARDLHVLQADDRVMEADGCERSAALAALHGAAADWLDKSRKGLPDNWDITPDGIVNFIRRQCFEVEPELARMRECENTRKPSPLHSWLLWCDKADDALTILRELQAIPGGE